ncbi:MAG: GNAT family N-acetyltransferase [Rubrivivax sp.]|nr:GNAT family N-acetyltransferase [Rubrivivax sp.]
MADWPDALLARIEDACLNASAPPQQRWLDGWLLRLQPGTARRARCIHALGPGRLTLAARLELAAAFYRQAELPLIFRITPFTQPSELDATLAQLEFQQVDRTHVLVSSLLSASTVQPLPAGYQWQPLAPAAFAEAIGALRDSPPAHRQAHAQRLQQAPIRHLGFVIRRDADGRVVCCGQFAREEDLVGLYDVMTHADERQQGWATLLCERMLSISSTKGAKTAYLQVDANKNAALQVYRRLGFGDGYLYHYRQTIPSQNVGA